MSDVNPTATNTGNSPAAAPNDPLATTTQPQSNTRMYLGIGAAVVVVISITLWWAFSGGHDADNPSPDRATTSTGDVMTKVLVVLTLAMAAMAAVISIGNRWTDTPIHQVVAIPLVIACAVLAYFAMYPSPLGPGSSGACVGVVLTPHNRSTRRYLEQVTRLQSELQGEMCGVVDIDGLVAELKESADRDIAEMSCEAAKASLTEMLETNQRAAVSAHNAQSGGSISDSDKTVSRVMRSVTELGDMVVDGVCEDGKVSQPLAMKLVGDLLHSVCPT